MSQISKCPKLRVVLGYWEALGEVSELRYKNLLYSSSQRSYCRTLKVDSGQSYILGLFSSFRAICRTDGIDGMGLVIKKLT